MERNSRTLAASISGIVSGLLIVLGTYFPWIRVKPGLPAETPIPAIYISGMDHGFEAAGGLVLVLLFLGLVTSVFLSSVRKVALIMLAVGLATIVVSLQNLLGGGYSFGVFVPAIGVYVTLVGGVGLFLSGGFEYVVGSKGLLLDVRR